MIYLDSAATSYLKPAAVKRAMVNAIETMASPGRGAYGAAMKAADKVYECRELACKLFNFTEPQNVVFTLNATHALNIAIRSLVSKGDKVIISGYEHNSVTRPLNFIGAKTVVAASPLFESGAVTGAIESNISGAKALVWNHVSNVFGYINPIYEIAELCRRHNVPMIVDASQSAGICRIDMSELNAAFVAMPGHKGLLGPQGTGILLCGEMPAPIICGGTGSESALQFMPEYLPDRAEAGTHNVVGIAGLCEGIRYVLDHGAEKIGEYEARLCRRAAMRLKKSPQLRVFASDTDNQAGVMSLQHSAMDCEAFCGMLGKRGIAARCGLHCAPLAHNTAGTIDKGTVRLSFSPFITQAQADRACSIIESAAKQEN